MSGCLSRSGFRQSGYTTLLIYSRKRSIYHFLKFLVLSGSDSDNEGMEEEEEEGDEYKEEEEKLRRTGSHRRKRSWIEAEVVLSESDIGWNSTAKRKRMDRTRRDIDWALNPNNYHQIM
jgi:hypothetical protein